MEHRAFNENGEYRDGFYVDEKRKRVWKTELDMLKAFDQLCRENNLTYFAEQGTLLGAVRHNGFVPWDDDLDLAMMREDYDRMLTIAPDYFQPPYFFQNAYTNPQVTFPFSKVRDDRTSAVEWPSLDAAFHQGIFLDVFPIDDVPDQRNYTTGHFVIVKELWDICVSPSEYAESVNAGKRKPVMQPDVLNAVLQMPVQERFRVFESALSEMAGKSELCNLITEVFLGKKTNRRREWYAEIIYVPFEDFSMPVPAQYDSILSVQYGDYRKPVRSGTYHQNAIIDPDRPYTEYLTIEPES